MPYTIRKSGKKVSIINKATGKVVGHSDSMAKARRSIGYRENAEKAKKTMPSKRT